MAFVFLLLPLIPAIALGEGLGGRHEDRASRAMRRSLWVCLLTHVLMLTLAAIAGLNLLTPRYFAAILVPGVLLAATALARHSANRGSCGAAGFTVITGWSLVVTKTVTGNFWSGWSDG